MHHICRTVSAIFLLMFSFLHGSASTPRFRTPDFAYPKTVEKNALRLISEADNASGHDAAILRLRGVLELCAAQRQIDRDSMFAQPAFIAGQAKRLDGSAKALMLTIEAKTYSGIYFDRRWTYDRVDAPMEPLPDDVSQWSGKQFRATISRLLAEAATLASGESLADYSDIIEYSPEALQYVPTVADFIALESCNTFSELGSDSKASATEAVRKALAKATPGSAPFFFWTVKDFQLAQYRPDTADKCMKIYEKWSNVEAARFLLDYAIDIYRPQTIPLRDSLIGTLRTSLRQFPGWYGNASLENRLNSLTAPTVSFTFPSMAATGKPFEVELKTAFARTAKVQVHRLPDNSDKLRVEQIAKTTPCVAKQSIKLTSVDTTFTMPFTIDRPGHYSVVVWLDGNLVDCYSTRRGMSMVPFLGIAVNGCTENAAIAADFTTGAPIKGVDVDFCLKSWRRGAQVKKPRNVGTTDASGIVTFERPQAEKDYFESLSFVYGGRSYNFDDNIGVSTFTPEEPTVQRHVNILTDRALYHPGDTIRWAIVAAISDGTSAPAVEAGAAFRVELFDANNQPAGSADVTTDALGRAYGDFATVKGLLTGNYRLRVSNAKDRSIASSSVMVSDFRMPVFEAKVSTVERDVPAKGAVRISGSARTFSGMPVADADVLVKISGARRWRWFSPSRELGSLNVRTDAQGTFSVDIPADMLSQTDADFDEVFSDFIASITVTTAAAETASTSCNFTTGKPFSLVVDVPKGIADTSSPVAIRPMAYNADGESKPLAVRWRIGVDDDGKLTKPLAEGEATTGRDLSLDLSALPAGTYSIELAPADTTMANTILTEDALTLYCETRNEIPAGDVPVFIPQYRYEATGSNVSVLLGARADATHVYVAVRCGETLSSVRHHEFKAGFHRIDFPACDSSSEIAVITVSKGKVRTQTINIVPAPEPKPQIIAESFRDRLTPGQTETWRFRMVDGSGKGLAGAGMIATMYNRALDELRGMSMSGRFAFDTRMPWLGVSSVSVSTFSDSYTKSFRHKNEIVISWPELMFMDFYAVRYGVMRKAALTGSVNGIVKEEYAADMAECESAVLEEPSMAMGVATTDSVEEESADDNESADEGGSSSPKEKDNFEYREAEVLQAFWKPSLVTDAEGNVDIVFTVPNANATWTFRAFGWTGDLKTMDDMRTALSNKPVMVQPNLPRFLRQGDRATLPVTVFNNSESAADVTVTIEIFDVATGKTVDAVERSMSIAPAGSQIATIDVEAPTTASAVGFRARAVAGSFADGEQTAIPVLESASSVIESTEFYLNPADSTPFEITVKPGKNATLTLQYCQNPVWTIVKAMRGLSGNLSTASGLASNLFSALAGRHITSSDHAIADALLQWKNNPGEKALVSMLEKNENLKKLMLDGTPWVQTAADQTSRMEALATLLDPTATTVAITSRISDLRKLQNADGGFAWGSWSRKSSLWTTETVLTTLGIANSLGMLKSSDGAKDIIAPAFAYIQKEAASRDKNSTDPDLALIAALFPELKLTDAGRAVVKRTVAHIAENWRNHSNATKAYDILILKANGADATASAVYESLRQFAVVKKDMGMCFPSVSDVRAYATIIQAYKAMGAPAADIDAMRQWIIVRAQATDDLGVYNPDYIIAAVLLTGTDWTSVKVEQNVTVDGRPLAIGSIESATGYFSQTLPATSGKKTTVRVVPNGVTPSYGSIISVSSKPMSKISARPGRDLSVEKRFLVERDGKWVSTDRFTAGERVRVQLIIKAGRDMEYVSIDDERPAAFEPVDQLPGYIYSSGNMPFYRENLDASTRMFIDYLPKGTWHLTFDMTAMAAGRFISGIATVQSQYAPELTAHSAGNYINISDK